MEDKFYLTKPGMEKMKEELKNLLLLKQEKAQTGIPVAFHSEELDTEFVAYKEELELLESQIADLEYIVKNAVLIQMPPQNYRHKIDLGARVIALVNDHEEEMDIVGTLEANPDLCKISNESPVGKALIGKQAGDTALVNSETKTAYKIIKVSYPNE